MGATLSQDQVMEALEYAKSYAGTFEFMVEMRKAAESGRTFSPGMVNAVLKCKARDDARMRELAEADAQNAEDPIDLRSLPEGTTHFAVELDGHMQFVRVDNVKDGGWIGWVFVKQQISESYERRGKQKPGGLYVGSLRPALKAILADPKAAAIRYGKELGVCAVCHTTLTNDESRELGIGPVCRKRFA